MSAEDSGPGRWAGTSGLSNSKVQNLKMKLSGTTISPPLHCMVVTPQNLVTSKSHQPAAKQAVVEKSNMGKVVNKDPEAILQTFSVWTARVRRIIESIQATTLQRFPIW